MAREGLMDDCGYNFDVDEDSYNSGFKDGFLAAVDEFAEKLKREYVYIDVTSDDMVYGKYRKYIDEIADQLKEE